MKTITGREINVKPNYSKRTFTIRVKDFKYRTMQMDKEEFMSAVRWTANDWQDFLRRTDEYYTVPILRSGQDGLGTTPMNRDANCIFFNHKNKSDDTNQ